MLDLLTRFRRWLCRCEQTLRFLPGERVTVLYSAPVTGRVVRPCFDGSLYEIERDDGIIFYEGPRLMRRGLYV